MSPDEQVVYKEKKRVLRGYNASASTYDELYSQEQHEKYVSAIQYSCHVRSPVLDCGCGTGLILESSMLQGKVYVGVDYSRNMLLTAKSRVREAEQASLVQADVEHLPFKDGSFASLVSFSLLEDLPDWTKVFAEMSRVTKRASYMIVSSLKKNFQHDSFNTITAKLHLHVKDFLSINHVKDYVVICVNS